MKPRKESSSTARSFEQAEKASFKCGSELGGAVEPKKRSKQSYHHEDPEAATRRAPTSDTAVVVRPLDDDSAARRAGALRRGGLGRPRHADAPSAHRGSDDGRHAGVRAGMLSGACSPGAPIVVIRHRWREGRTYSDSQICFLTLLPICRYSRTSSTKMAEPLTMGRTLDGLPSIRTTVRFQLAIDCWLMRKHPCELAQ